MGNVRDQLPTKADVERALGFALSTFERLKDGSSPNFRAVRATDALPFLVKLLPPSRRWVLPALKAHLEEMAGTRSVHRLFQHAPEDIGSFKMICLEWCEGASKMPHRLSTDELHSFLDAYAALSDELQRTTHIASADDLTAWRRKILSSGGLWARPIIRFVKRHVAAAEIVRNPERTRVIFGDFHHGNVLFKDGCVNRFIDLESFSYGYETEDIIRYFTCALEHLPLGGIFHWHRTLEAFREVVDYLPYGRDEWLLAIDAQILRKFEGYDRYTPLKTINLLLRTRFYESLRNIVLTHPVADSHYRPESEDSKEQRVQSGCT